MSEKKFNLKTYQKINGSEHIDMRLEEARGNIPNVINEKQLESYRSKEADVTIEKLLEDKRTGEETEITEKRLDTHKSKFANKYRNPSAHEGDMNKLEEQRLMDDPAEKEKYEAASSVGKQLRWWEGVKGEDGLKLAKTTTEKKTLIARRPHDEFEDPEEKVEEMSFDRPRWRDVGEKEEAVEDTGIPEDLPKTEEDYEVIEKAQTTSKDISAQDFSIQKEFYLPNADKALSGINMVLSYDPEVGKGNEQAIKDAALEKVLSIRPELAGKISSDDFGKLEEGGGEGIVRLRVLGEEFAPIVEKNKSEQTHVDIKEKELDTEESLIKEISFEELNLEGTPTSIGRIEVDPDFARGNQEEVIKKIVTFIKDKHPKLEIESNSLDTSDLESKGEVRFMVGSPLSEIETQTTGDITYNERLSPEENARIQREMGMTAEEIMEEDLKNTEELENMPPETEEEFPIEEVEEFPVEEAYEGLPSDEELAESDEEQNPSLVEQPTTTMTEDFPINVVQPPKNDQIEESKDSLANSKRGITIESISKKN